uniref:DUF38 domain-containing protein n=1 Tax=Panagrolaimus sp. JU765 TaxID=591449 RepID=A0AC34QCG2_9BILA
MISNCNQEMDEKTSANLELNKQIEVVKKSILKLKSQKNRLLNPVCLSSDLYADILEEVSRQQIMLKLEDVLKFFIIGKEAQLPIVQFMKQCVKMKFFDDYFLCENDDAALRLTYCKFSEILIKPIIPYVTKQEQKSLTISYLKHVNELVIEVLKKLNDRNIPIKLSHPEKKLLFELPGVHFDILKIGKWDSSIKEWFHFLATNSLPCTFTKLQLPHVEWRSREEWGEEVIINVEELLITWDFNDGDLHGNDFFGRLNKHFPNAQKLTVTFLKTQCPCRTKYFDEPKYSKDMWNRRKNYITNAPQKEVVANFRYVTDSKRKYERAIKLFGGERIDGNTLRWTSPTNNSKIINFHHELSAVKVDHVDIWGLHWGSDINSESGLSDAEIDSESDFEGFDMNIDSDVEDL